MTKETTTKGIIALCACAFVHSYLLISVFPYSGFMAMSLIPSVDEENAGSYAGLLASAFMFGRAITSYGWGQVADAYGRRFVLLASLLLSFVFSLLFGISTSFPHALLWRFFLGLANGMLGTAKTAVSELTDGDDKLEARAMGLVVGMWGWGILFSPVISGALSEPIRQYPHLFHDEESGVYRFVDSYPFFLPNLAGALLCLVCIALVHFFVIETLPEHQIRDAKHLPSDILSSLRHLIPSISTSSGDERIHMKRVERGGRGAPVGYGAVGEGEAAEIPEELFALVQEDVGDAIRESMKSYDEEPTLFSDENRRRSLSDSISRRASVDMALMTKQSSSQRLLVSEMNVGTEQPQQATIQSLWSQVNTRNHMIIYWIACFLSISVDEGFPLFCLSKEAGLGLTENSIGAILSVSGMLLLLLQYFIYSALVDNFGIGGTIRVTTCAFGPLIALIPVSLLLLNHDDDDHHHNHDGQQEWYDDNSTSTTLNVQAFSFLSSLMALYRVIFLAFFSSIVVAMNRSVVPAHRGTMNGLAALGGSVFKTLGPSFAGFLASFSLSSGVFPPRVGAVFMWLVIGALGGGILSWTTSRLLRKEESL